MPIETRWDNTRKTIIFTKFSGNWTMDDYHVMIDTMYTMITSVNHHIYLINDFTDSLTSPTKMLSAGRHMEAKSADTQHRIRLAVVVNAGNFLTMLTGLVQKMFLKDAKIQFVNSLEEAYRVVEHHEHKMDGSSVAKPE